MQQWKPSQNKKTTHRMGKNVCECNRHVINLPNIQTVLQLYVKKMTQSKNGQWSKWTVLQQDIQMTQKHMKRCLTSLIIIEMQIKTIMRYNLPWVRISVKSLSHVWFFVTPWTVAFQDPLSMEFSRQEYWSGLPFSLCAKSVQSCPTLHDPMDCSPSGSSVHAIL